MFETDYVSVLKHWDEEKSFIKGVIKFWSNFITSSNLEDEENDSNNEDVYKKLISKFLMRKTPGANVIKQYCGKLLRYF